MCDELMELPKFKDCSCGASLRVAPVRFDSPIDGLKVGVTDCSFCNKAHFIFAGDLALVDEFYEIFAAGFNAQEVKRRTWMN